MIDKQMEMIKHTNTYDEYWLKASINGCVVYNKEEYLKRKEWLIMDGYKALGILCNRLLGNENIMGDDCWELLGIIEEKIDLLILFKRLINEGEIEISPMVLKANKALGEWLNEKTK